MNFKIEKNQATIFYTIRERTTKEDPFYLQNLMYDLPFDLEALDSVSIEISVPKKLSVHIVDDLHFVNKINNTISVSLEENSMLAYQFFVANHELCNACERKGKGCQTLPSVFEKVMKINLNGKYASAYIKCHYMGDKNGMFKLKTEQNHNESETTSKVIVKSVLDDQAKFTVDNTTYIKENLSKIKAEQENRNLMLSEKAHVITTPKLQINSSDISCSHGVSISSLDQKELFYLESRGLNKQKAELTLVEAFLNI